MVDVQSGRSAAKRSSARFVRRYDWSIENVSGEGRQRGAMGSWTVVSRVRFRDGEQREVLAAVVRMRWWVGYSVTLRFCATEEWP